MADPNYITYVLEETPEVEPVPHRDEKGYFDGWRPSGCEHRTTGDRAWCFDCQEWCYPSTPCVRCERGILLREIKRLADGLGARMRDDT